MRTKKLKEILNSLTEDQLKGRVVYIGKDRGISGQVNDVGLATEHLYYDGEDDPSELLTKSQIHDMDENVRDYIIEVKKGDIVISL